MTTFQKVVKYCAVAFALFLIVSIIAGICGAVRTVSLLLDGNTNAAGEMRTFTVGSDIESLEIDIGAADLKIVSGDEFSLESNHKYLKVKEKNGTLVISEERKSLITTYDGVSAVLTVPKDFEFKKAEISAGAGKLTVDTLTANTVDLDLGAGAAEIGCLNVPGDGEIDGGTGKLVIRDGELNNTDMDIGVGKLELTGRLTGDCSMDYGVGGAQLVLLGNKDDYQIRIDKGLGSATLDGEKLNDDSVFGDGENRIDIDGGVGAVDIRFS